MYDDSGDMGLPHRVDDETVLHLVPDRGKWRFVAVRRRLLSLADYPGTPALYYYDAYYAAPPGVPR